MKNYIGCITLAVCHLKQIYAYCFQSDFAHISIFFAHISILFDIPHQWGGGVP